MISAVEQRFYQGVVDGLQNEEWIPDYYYTVVPGSKIATPDISQELLDAVEPFLGEILDERTQISVQRAVDSVVNDRTQQREILIWVTPQGEPLFIECLRVVQNSDYSYRIAPYTDRTKIMEEVLAKMEKENGTSF